MCDKIIKDLNSYRLDILRGSILICTVQMFLLNTGLYIAEFTRGHFDIFQFKRFYEAIRRKLSQIVKSDYSATIRQQLDALPYGSRYRRRIDQKSSKVCGRSLKRTLSSHR